MSRHTGDRANPAWWLAADRWQSLGPPGRLVIHSYLENTLVSNTCSDTINHDAPNGRPPRGRS